MDQTGLWELFFATGLPQAWLALRGLEGVQDAAAAMAPQEERPVSG